MAQQLANGRRADGLATIFAIATTNPPNTIEQKTFPDHYFALTQSQHLIDLKNKFQRICDKTAIRKRHVLWDDDLIRSNPCLWTPSEPSLNLRQKIALEAVPRMGAEAAEKAIEEWGQPKSAITHLIFCTTSAVDLPGSDFNLVHRLGLELSVQRFMLTHQGCSAGGTVLRLAKSIAESNKSARILTVSSETTIAFVKEPHDERGNLVAHAIFGDGAVSTVVGSNSFLMEGERPLFSIFSTSQVILPNSKDSICVHLDDRGLDVQILKDVPLFILKHIGECLQKSFAPLGITDWNSIFWSCHPGGRAILDRVEERLCLKKEKLHAARYVLSEYGNMASACVLFILDEVRKRSLRNGHTTTGEGYEWGVLLGMGPGISVETIVLKSYPIP